MLKNSDIQKITYLIIILLVLKIIMLLLFKKNIIVIPNTTKIIIAQRVSSVMDADVIVIMNNGRVDAFGTHEKLLAENEIYKEVYYSQNKSTALEGGEINE